MVERLDFQDALSKFYYLPGYFSHDVALLSQIRIINYTRKFSEINIEQSIFFCFLGISAIEYSQKSYLSFCYVSAA